MGKGWTVNVATKENTSQERWLFSILKAIYDGVMVVDARGTIVYANPAYTRIFGVPVEKVLGRRLAEIEPASRVLEVLRTGKPLIDDPAHVISAGVDIVTNITPIYEDDILVGAVAIFRDQSEVFSLHEILKKAQREVEKTRNLADRYYTELQELRARFLDVGDLIYSSQQMKKIIDLVLQLANVDSTVLITGESGVGKEIIAKLIHRTSRRSKEAFVTVN
ncbi:MAG: sigma 54-interacting transcriptional regulator, partial [Desulfotomaculales bacterium]